MQSKYACVAASPASQTYRQNWQPKLLTSAGEDGAARLGDFGLAEAAGELAAELADARSVLSGGKPSGGFYKRHVVRTMQRSVHTPWSTP